MRGTKAAPKVKRTKTLNIIGHTVQSDENTNKNKHGNALRVGNSNDQYPRTNQLGDITKSDDLALSSTRIGQLIQIRYQTGKPYTPQNAYTTGKNTTPQQAT